MTTYSKWDIVLVEFVFLEGGGTKRRPAYVLSDKKYNNKRQEIIVAGITTNVKQLLVGDTKLTKWRDAGLLKPSRATAIIQTIKQSMIERKLGRLKEKDFLKIEKNLIGVFRFQF